MIVYSTASMRSVDPSTSRRAPNCVVHSALLSTTTGAGSGGASSLAAKYRPSTGGASKKPKNAALTTAMFRTRVASPVPTARRSRSTAAACEKAEEYRTTSITRAYCPPVPLSLPLEVR